MVFSATSATKKIHPFWWPLAAVFGLFFDPVWTAMETFPRTGSDTHRGQDVTELNGKLVSHRGRNKKGSWGHITEVDPPPEAEVRAETRALEAEGGCVECCGIGSVPARREAGSKLGSLVAPAPKQKLLKEIIIRNQFKPSSPAPNSALCCFSLLNSRRCALTCTAHYAETQRPMRSTDKNKFGVLQRHPKGQSHPQLGFHRSHLSLQSIQLG